MSEPVTYNLMIGTPAYGGMVHIDYLRSILNLHKSGIHFSVLNIGNESLITRARNSVISKFHEQQEFTHLLFLDGDIYIDAKDIQRLLDHGKDVIGAPVPLKGHDANGFKIYNTGRNLGEDGPLIVMDRIGTAVLLLSRKAVTDLIADAETAGRCYQPGCFNRGAPESSIQYDVFQVGVRDGDYLSEDFWICMKLQELGYRIHVDPAIAVRHNGVVEF